MLKGSIALTDMTVSSSSVDSVGTKVEYGADGAVTATIGTFDLTFSAGYKLDTKMFKPSGTIALTFKNVSIASTSTLGIKDEKLQLNNIRGAKVTDEDIEIKLSGLSFFEKIFEWLFKKTIKG